MNRITLWQKSTDEIVSQWGLVTNLEWCRLESARMNRVNKFAHYEAKVEGGLVCIVRTAKPKK